MIQAIHRISEESVVFASVGERTPEEDIFLVGIPAELPPRFALRHDRHLLHRHATGDDWQNLKDHFQKYSMVTNCDFKMATLYLNRGQKASLAFRVWSADCG